MRNLCVVALVAFVFGLGQVETASAQQPTGKPGIVAVLDLTKVFKDHPTHKAKMDALQQKFEKLKQKYQKEQADLQIQAQEATKNFQGEQLKNFELEIQQKNARIRTQARQSQEDLMKSEAQIYYQTYQHVMGIVENLCKQYNVTLVLRYDSTPIDPSKPQTVIRGVQKSVVFFNADLTPHVLQAVRGPATSAARK